MAQVTKERAFEDAIEGWLLARGGYERGANTDFDPALGLDTHHLFTFLGATQAETFERLTELHGGDPDAAQRKFAERLGKEIDRRGAVDVLRHGVEDLGVHLDLAYFRPATGLNPETKTLYDANRLSVTRQLNYAGDAKALDLVLFCNGLPVATAELKNPLTGQTHVHAMAQYRTDRDPRNVLLALRALVHFAVDPDWVMMTTELRGRDTTFLPFNRGSNPGGKDCGKGNPPNPDGYATSYLWERVWQRDAWLDVLHRFVHVELDEPGAKAKAKQRGTLIFPRYQQWDCVRSLEGDARTQGAGAHYLVQHSAGSGKSNTIAWLAHRLASLHDESDTKVFDKVVVITDRRVLDRQLQDTIYQFEHAHGVVAKIEESSGELAEALRGAEAKIIVTTLQKFPFVTDEVEKLPERRYALLIDEAHSSQTGEMAANMRKVLASEEAEVPDDDDIQSYADALAERMAKGRGRHENLSLFAFTATPKPKTLEVFGTPTGDGEREAFHLYSMRQAIEEGFIRDVCESYTTYTSYWRVANASTDDPEVDPGKASAAIARFAQLHPEHVAQKAEICVEHVRSFTMDKIAGRAKAMVVTSSRLHAVRWRQAIDRYLNEHGIADLRALVAFSGTVRDGGMEFTEARMNGFPETQTAERFADTDAYRLLVVAEKFQTGFDQPLLHTMFVDKKLHGVNAVQTLSRLNRIHPDKDDTFVLDFVNTADEIEAAFEPYYETTVATETDPNLLFDARAEVHRFGVVRDDEVDAFARVYFASDRDDKTAQGKLYAVLEPAVGRFEELDPDDQDEFRKALRRFVKLYAFVAQIMPLADTQLEKRYAYCRHLSQVLPRQAQGTLDLGELSLTHLRVQKRGAHRIQLGDSLAEPLESFRGDGTGQETLPGMEQLSVVIDRVNEAYGLSLTEADRLHLEGIVADMVSDPTRQQRAAANSQANFGLTFDDELKDALADRLDQARDLTIELLRNDEARDQIASAVLPKVYEKSRVAYQKVCPVGELLRRDEDQYLEFKSSLRWGLREGEKSKLIEGAVLKTVAAFLNSEHGGTLLIGVGDGGEVVGLEPDYASLRKEGKGDRDLFILHLNQIIENAVGLAASANVTTTIHEVDGKGLCRVHIEPSNHPVYARVTTKDSKGQFGTEEKFFIRRNNATRAIDDDREVERYVAGRWGPT